MWRISFFYFSCCSGLLVTARTESNSIDSEYELLYSEARVAIGAYVCVTAKDMIYSLLIVIICLV